MTDEQIAKIAESYQDARYGSISFNRINEFARALLSASQPAAPQGWKLVPVEPTEHMIRAACLKQSNVPLASYDEWLDGHSSGVSERIRDLVAGDYRALLAASPAAPAQSAEPLGKNALTLTAAQLLEALDFIAPDRDADQMESEVAIEYGEGHSGKAMYCWCAEYPEEGSFVLDGKSGDTAPQQPAEAGEASTFEPVGRCECAFSQDECEVCTANREAYEEHQREQSAPVLDDERAAFEAWYRKEIQNDAPMYRRDFKGSDRFGEYCQWFQEEAWKAWQARAASPQATATPEQPRGMTGRRS